MLLRIFLIRILIISISAILFSCTTEKVVIDASLLYGNVWVYTTDNELSLLVKSRLIFNKNKTFEYQEIIYSNQTNKEYDTLSINGEWIYLEDKKTIDFSEFKKPCFTKNLPCNMPDIDYLIIKLSSDQLIVQEINGLFAPPTETTYKSE